MIDSVILENLNREGIDIYDFALGLAELPKEPEGKRTDNIGRFMPDDISGPVSTFMWDRIREQYRERTHISVPCSHDLIRRFGTWEDFWRDEGYDVKEWTRQDIVSLTLEKKPWSILTGDELDRHFPERPSKSYVMEVFGGWDEYIDAVKDARWNDTIVIKLAEKINEDIPITWSDVWSKDQRRPKKNRHLKGKKIQGSGTKRLSIDDIADRPIEDFRFYDGENKQRIRKLMASMAKSLLPSHENLRYFGLEGVNFKSYIRLNKEGVTIDPSKSMVAEKDMDAAQIMAFIVENYERVVGGEMLKGLFVANAYAHDSLFGQKDPFDLINLDFNGGWSRSKERALESIFKNKLVEDDALLFVSLLDSGCERFRVKRGNGRRNGYGTDNQTKLLDRKIQYLSGRHGFCSELVHSERYTDTQDMIFSAYHIRRC